jgi:hypothetical protein
LIGPHECPITRAEEKLRIDEGTEQRVTRSAVEAPQPLRLRRRQPQSRHFAILALNPSQYVVKRLLCFHEPSPFPDLMMEPFETEQRGCQRFDLSLRFEGSQVNPHRTKTLPMSRTLSHFIPAL